MYLPVNLISSQNLIGCYLIQSTVKLENCSVVIYTESPEY